VISKKGRFSIAIVKLLQIGTGWRCSESTQLAGIAEVLKKSKKLIFIFFER
jgi:hypothetical protein